MVTTGTTGITIQAEVEEIAGKDKGIQPEILENHPENRTLEVLTEMMQVLPGIAGTNKDIVRGWVQTIPEADTEEQDGAMTATLGEATEPFLSATTPTSNYGYL